MIPPPQAKLTQVNDHFIACDQRYEDMPEQGKGRLCQACDRVLLDFTQMPVHEMIRFQADNDFKHCGNYTHQQVQAIHYHLQAEEMPKRPGMGWLVSLAIGALGLTSLNAAAQETPNPTQQIEGHMLDKMFTLDMDTTCLTSEKGRPDNPVPCKKVNNDLTDEVVQVEALDADTSGLEQVTIKGVLTDSTTGEPLPFANVTLLQGDQIIAGGMSDFVGEYSITISKDTWEEKREELCLEFSYVGYHDKMIPVNGSLSQEEEELVAIKGVFACNEEVVPVEELYSVIAVAGIIPNYSPPVRKKIGRALNPANWYRRIKWKIRSKRGY